jgi:AraC-like DNA-binding protein
MGVTESDKSEIALAVGYKNPRSENFSKAFRELVDDGTFRKAGGGKDKVSLTARGESMIPKDLEVSNDPSKIHQRYIEFVEKKVKVGSDKVRRVWNILQDRKEHPIADLATALGYSNPRSFGNTKIIAVMREAGLVEGKGGVMFTSKVPV